MKKSKRIVRLLVMSFVSIGLMAVGGCGTTPKSTSTESKPEEPIYQRPAKLDAKQALQLLVDGNKRFVDGKVLKKDMGSTRREDLATNGQKPFAVVLTCSDSRVPPELLFDQALGDIFVVRVAGNVVSPVEMGSIEYGAEHLGTPLLIILGHENCGAVKATVDGGEAPGSIGTIIDLIKPSVEKAKAAGASGDTLYEKACDENITAMVAEVEKSHIIKELVEKGELKVVGAKYHLGSGEVVFDQAK